MKKALTMLALTMTSQVVYAENISVNVTLSDAAMKEMTKILGENGASVSGLKEFKINLGLILPKAIDEEEYTKINKIGFFTSRGEKFQSSSLRCVKYSNAEYDHYRSVHRKCFKSQIAEMRAALQSTSGQKFLALSYQGLKDISINLADLGDTSDLSYFYSYDKDAMKEITDKNGDKSNAFQDVRLRTPGKYSSSEFTRGSIRFDEAKVVDLRIKALYESKKLECSVIRADGSNVLTPFGKGGLQSTAMTGVEIPFYTKGGKMQSGGSIAIFQNIDSSTFPAGTSCPDKALISRAQIEEKLTEWVDKWNNRYGEDSADEEMRKMVSEAENLNVDKEKDNISVNDKSRVQAKEKSMEDESTDKKSGANQK